MTSHRIARTGHDSNLLTLSATMVHDHFAEGGPTSYPDKAQGIEFTAILDTPEAAVEFVARFPKSAKLRATTLGTYDDAGNFTLGYVSHRINLRSDGVNGGVNETGIKRYRSILKAAEKAGIRVEFKGTGFLNSYPTQADLNAAL